MTIRKVDGVTITATEETTGICVEVHRDVDDKKLGEVLIESFEGLRKIHVYIGEDDELVQSFDLEDS